MIERILIAAASADGPIIGPSTQAFDPAKTHSDIILSNNNKTMGTSTGKWVTTVGNAKIPQGGKYYLEMEGGETLFGMTNSTIIWSSEGQVVGNSGTGVRFGVRPTDGYCQINGPASTLSGLAWGGMVVMHFAVDTVVGAVWVGTQGVWLGDPVAGTNPFLTGLDVTDLWLAASTFKSNGTIRTSASEFTHEPPVGFSTLP